MVSNEKTPRRQQILQALAAMLESAQGKRITTSALAKEVGVSEAALYRHFPSKSKMFEGLIDFIEEALFSRISLIDDEAVTALEKCEKMLFLVLGFCSKNPGITRVLTGDALMGETAKLRARTGQLFDRLETQLKQILREAEMREGLHFGMTVSQTVALMMAATEGKIAQFVRSDFRRAPVDGWQDQWQYLTAGLTVKSPAL